MIDFQAFHIENFTDPTRLWFLLVLPLFLVVYLLVLLRKKNNGIRYSNTAFIAKIFPKQSQKLRHLAVLFSILSLVALNIAWANPVGTKKEPQERATVVLIVDSSNSMLATDISPSRLAAAKETALKFLSQVPDKYNVALLSMSANSIVLAPATKDRELVKRGIQNLKTSDGTALGDAVFAAIKTIEIAPGGVDKEPAPGVIVILSDGGDNYGRDPEVAAAEAKKKGIPIYTVNFGTDYGYVDLDSERYPVPSDGKLLTKLAEITNGKSFDAKTGTDLASTYSSLKSVVGYREVQSSTAESWIGLALVLGVLASICGVLVGSRVL